MIKNKHLLFHLCKYSSGRVISHLRGVLGVETSVTNSLPDATAKSGLTVEKNFSLPLLETLISEENLTQEL